jgi:hypothetical protein
MLAILSVPVSASAPAAAQRSLSWLDRPLHNWNVPGGPIPRAPSGGAEDIEACKSTLRPPAGKEDRAVVAAGWALAGPPQTASGTRVIVGEADADGMCRPIAYQIFLFVRGQFAGTISPVRMNSREDGSAGAVDFSSASEFRVEFGRYKESDALCCPSRQSDVWYGIKDVAGHPLVVPQRKKTTTNPPN